MTALKTVAQAQFKVRVDQDKRTWRYSLEAESGWRTTAKTNWSREVAIYRATFAIPAGFAFSLTVNGQHQGNFLKEVR